MKEKMVNMEIVIKSWWIEIQQRRKCHTTSKTAKLVNKSTPQVQAQVRTLVSQCIKDSISECYKCGTIKIKQDTFNAINACFDNFTQATDAVDNSFSEIIVFINDCFNECTDNLIAKRYEQCDLVRVFDFLHSLSRVLVLLLKLRRPLKVNDSENQYVSRITKNEKALLTGLSQKLSTLFPIEDIVLDTKCTLAMACVLIREILYEDERKLAEYHSNFVASLPVKINEKEHELNILKFLLGNAILNIWSNSVAGASTTAAYLRFFVQLCESYASDTGILLNICRTLLLLIKNDCFQEFMDNLPPENNYLVNSLLSCVHMLLDHPIPCVRHSSKEFLRILAVHEKFKTSIMKSLPTLLVHKRSYFVSLAAIANEAGSQFLFNVDTSLPTNLVLALNDPALVAHVIDALEVIIVKDCLVETDFPKWCERWIVSLLVSLTKVPFTALSDIEKLLKKLFTLYPSAVFYVTAKWYQPKDDELRYVMAALKIYHKLDLKMQEDINLEVNIQPGSVVREKKWKDLISEKLLFFCLHHSDDDIRVSAFSLVVEGLKSTEKYTKQDFNLIRYSLSCNLNNQLPATRQQYLSLAKKMLSRYSDSWAVLRRERKQSPRSSVVQDELANYNRFQEWLIDFCFSNIFDGANFNRLNTVLSLLSLYIEILKDIRIPPPLIDECWKKILVALRSSYEENKIIAVTLAKKLNILKLLRDNRIVKPTFQRAYELCGKMEPPNVLTGVYLMLTLLQYPAIKEAIRDYYSEDMNAIDSDLLFIILLSRKLKEQMCQAEKNLLDAAMNGPMYGSLFAIRIIFEETEVLKFDENIRSDALPEVLQAFRMVIKDLIEICFRIIHTVSCVVNSSSPEGHLPADFDMNFESPTGPDDLPKSEEKEEKGEEEENKKGKEEENKKGKDEKDKKGKDEKDKKGKDEKDKKRVEEGAASGTSSGSKGTGLDYSRPVRGKKVIINDCQRFVRRYNKMFLSHGDSRSFSRQNVVDFKDLLKTCSELMSDMNRIQSFKVTNGRKSSQDFELLKCLGLIEKELNNCISIYEKQNSLNDGPSAQVLLLCSWRCIKETCLFLGLLVSKLPLEKMFELELLTEDMVLNMGLELRTLLCEIKHRGAFEHAYVGFTQLITAFWKCPRKNLNELPNKWLEEILCEIQQPVENQKMKFCSSRRSAGLPFLVQAIICTELHCTKSAKIHSLDTTMSCLFDVSEAEDDSVSLESKIHSLNILRALFKSAALGEHVAPYVSQGLMIAVRGSRNAAWSIRNSSSLLFSALIIRIFGVARHKDALSKKNRMTGRHFFQRYPELYEFFLYEMQLAFKATGQNQIYYPQSHVFHILLILGRLYPSPNEDPPGIDFSEFLPFINTSCHNATLKIRELGAKALVPLICPDKFVEELDMRFSLLNSAGADSNYKHGILLQVRTILTEMWEKISSVQESFEERGQNWIRDTQSILNVGKPPKPYLIKISYIQILHMLSKVSLALRLKVNELLNTRELLDDAKNSNEIEKHVPGRFAYLETLYFVKFDNAAQMWLDNGNNRDLIESITSMLESDIVEIHAVALVFLQYISSEKYQELTGDEDAKLITMKLQDLYCIRNEETFEAIKSEILSQPSVRQYVIQSFVSLIINANYSTQIYNTITTLQISVISNFLLQSLVSVRDIYDSLKNTQGVSCSILGFLSDLVDCGSYNISVPAFICYSVFFFENLQYDFGELKPNNISHFTKLLFTFSDADAYFKQRKAACEIFYKYYHCFNHDLFKKDNRAMSIWMLPLRLMADEEAVIRKRAMGLIPKYQNYFRENPRYLKFDGEFDDVSLCNLTGIPSKAQETLLDYYIRLLDKRDLFHLVVQLVGFCVSAYVNTVNYEYISKQNEDGVFEKGNPNPFCEELMFGKLLSGTLEKIRDLVDVRALFRRRLQPTHIANLKELFPSLVLPYFPRTLHEFCTEILEILEEEYSDNDFKIMSCLPIYVSELVDAFEL